jgi:hypothetical protein
MSKPTLSAKKKAKIKKKQNVAKVDFKIRTTGKSASSLLHKNDQDNIFQGISIQPKDTIQIPGSVNNSERLIVKPGFRKSKIFNDPTLTKEQKQLLEKKNEQEFIRLLTEFLYNTIVGHESEFYKMVINKDALQKSISKLICTSASDYLNKAYKSLITDNDEYFVEYFNGMADLLDHSHICLLNIACSLLTTCHEAINREILDITSYDNYIIGIHIQITKILDIVRKEMVDKLTHDCVNIDIKSCNPEVELFVVEEIIDDE